MLKAGCCAESGSITPASGSVVRVVHPTPQRRHVRLGGSGTLGHGLRPSASLPGSGAFEAKTARDTNHPSIANDIPMLRPNDANRALKVVDRCVVQLNMNTPPYATAARSHGCNGLPRPSGSNEILRRARLGTKCAGKTWSGTKRLLARGRASHGHARIKPPSKPSAVKYTFAAVWSYERTA